MMSDDSYDRLACCIDRIYASSMLFAKHHFETYKTKLRSVLN